MDDLMDFFDSSKNFKRGTLPRGCISGDPNAYTSESSDSKPIKREIIGTKDVNEIVQKEQQLMNQLVGGPSNTKRTKTLDELESDDDDKMELNEAPTVRSDEAFYEKYHFDLNRNRSLPIYAQREQIMKAIKENPVVILKGETGCGKTTQVPQYILDEAFKKREFCNIVVTQPRRIAAISIANRVCQERRWQPGTVCSYQVGLHKQSNSADTRLLYCTTGVLLNNLIRLKTLTHYTHIVLDEVHDRDQDMDFLLIVVRRLLALNSRHVKVILMSATIDTREFCKYFASCKSMPPVVAASHGRKYPLVKYYRDQLKNINWKTEPQQREPGITHEGYRDAVKILLVIDNMERKAEGQSEQSYEEAKRTGSVLIFLPGVNEIDTMAEHIEHVMNESPNIKITIVRCHSLMSSDSQEDVFQPPLSGHRKVILTTNIAESSITVTDVSYVIDFCLAKVMHIDTASNFSCLCLEWASKVNCRQRAGRVGRTRSGRVYRMVTKAFYMEEMQEFGIPEMLRSPLQSSVLKAKELDMGGPSEILALAMSPPNLTDIHNTVLLLKEVGALYTTVDGVYEQLDGDLTYWGTIMSRFPLDVRLSRLIILGYIFNCLDEAIIIAAGMSVRSLYLSGQRQRTSDAFWMHYIFADGSGSDLVGFWRVYKIYVNMCQNLPMKDSEVQWARRYNVSLRSLKEMYLLVQELQKRCAALNLVSLPVGASHMWHDREKSIILKVIIAGAFYPNYFTRNNKTIPDYDRDVYHSICGNDPCRTVYFTQFVPRYMGELYTRRVKELFLEARIPPEKIDVTFQQGSEKIFVTFKGDDDDYMNSTDVVQVPGRVTTEVYKAIRMRMNNPNRSLRVMDQNSALKYVQQRNIGVVQDSKWVPPSKQWNVELLTLPSVFDKKITGLITYIVNCGKFYFQPRSLAERIASMTEIFNAPEQLSYHVRNASAITKGLQLLARRGSKFQRAVVLKVEPQSNAIPQFLVRFIDYGDWALLAMDQLRLMRHELRRDLEELPPRMFECRLALVQPSSVTSYSNRWPQKANEMLSKLASCGPLELEVYSLVNNVAAVLIHMRDGVLNDKLVEHQLARRADEDYMSRKDHDFRIRKQKMKRYVPAAEQQQVNEEYLRFNQLPQDADLEPPPLDKCHTSIRLKGPYSPLENSMNSMLRIGMYKSVAIEKESVNAVLLDADPQDRHDQMIVAASVTESDGNDKLVARGTTLMPNIHGFGALMAMLFCPTMQIKCNPERTKYVCLLAGLGFNPDTLEPYFQEHDMVINLDVGILKDDIRIINQMRYNIDSMFFNFDANELPAVGVEGRLVIFNQLRNLLTRLLGKDRSFIERHVWNSKYVWEDMSDLEPPSEPYGKRAIFPMHGSYDLESEDMGNLLALQENCSELYDWQNFDGVMQPRNCRLCNETLESVTQLRLHLLTQLHRDREKQVGWKQQ
ncbi:probable ATP-dependent RNA helicase spindle-E [Drosophila grimshawi]|uniref:Probable ATP-dependent RNA helicase spindle-E n=1 Tax=Drosophila grimshawi TaxID=7222 RepID=SPNE_DROGR|nr:probable ATP-dependent RNA helicase spindle-E [Drosophila grimshawi]B4JT42.1 RecName: Full=Probable ATP-dependent RNA helicase spindle-E; AltName: Full=Homeless [Drosophila grimshawi]EDV94932.1 GH23451 [Drosophila grimshawi]